MSVARALIPLVVAAAASAALVAIAPHLPVSSPAAQDLSAVGLAVGAALGALHVSSAGKLSGLHLWLTLGLGVAALAVMRLAGFAAFAAPLQVLALLCVARAAGGGIGERVSHAGHVLPASIIAAAADCASLLTPEGPSHAVMESERTLAVLALAAPVPGTNAIAFVLGIGDLLMIALLLAVARKFSISAARVTIASAAALAVAFVASAILQAAIPALVPICLVVNAVVPQFRDVPKRDRKVAVAAGVIAAGLLVFVALRR